MREEVSLMEEAPNAVQPQMLPGTGGLFFIEEKLIFIFQVLYIRLHV